MQNHIGKKAQNITPELAKKYGISYPTIQKAYRGDVKANQEIGKLANKGEIAAKMAPLVQQRVQQIIAGTNAVNESDALILKAVKDGTLKIEQAQDSMELADNDLTFKRIENAQKHQYALQNNLQKHNENVEYLTQNQETTEVIMRADFEYRMQALEAKIPLAQLQADRQNIMDRGVHALQMGENTNFDLVPQKEYGLAAPIRKVFRWVFGN